MCAEENRPEKSLSNRSLGDNTELREFVDLTMNMAQEQLARSRDIVARSHDIVSRTRKTLMHSIRIQQGPARHEPGNPGYRKLPDKEG